MFSGAESLSKNGKDGVTEGEDFLGNDVGVRCLLLVGHVCLLVGLAIVVYLR